MSRAAIQQRDRLIERAISKLTEGHLLLLRALTADEQVGLIDKVGTMALAQTADKVTSAIRTVQGAQQWAQQHRRHYDRQAAAEEVRA